MSIKDMKNKDWKYLLSDTEEKAENDLGLAAAALKALETGKADEFHRNVTQPVDTLTWEDVHRTPYTQTSLTQDMRRMNTQRLLQEVRSQIERVAENSIRDGFTQNAIQRRVSDMLHHYRDMGSIQSFRIDSLQQELAPGYPAINTTFNLTIVPTATVERINMEVRLTT